MRVPLKMVIPSKFSKIHSPDEPNGIIFQESCFETPRRCSCRVFFFGPRSSGRLNDSKVATCQKVGQCESHTGAAWLFLIFSLGWFMGRDFSGFFVHILFSSLLVA